MKTKVELYEVLINIQIVKNRNNKYDSNKMNSICFHADSNAYNKSSTYLKGAELTLCQTFETIKINAE